MRVLHVAALPFPSPQGTQGLIAAMLRADADAGVEPHLLCYPSGLGVVDARVRIARVAERFVRRTSPADLRSGPSLRKWLLDVALARALAARVSAIAPTLIIAHHVEAALCCAAVLPKKSWIFCAHTSLEYELSSYLPDAVAGPAGVLGLLFDRAAARRAAAVLSVSPLLSQHLRQRLARDVRTLPLPWPSAAPTSPDERSASRRAFGFADDARVVLYAGNLDAYQGLPFLCDALERLCRRDPRTRFLVATASASSELDALLTHVPTLASRTRVAPLTNEAERRNAHAAATVVAVPRVVPGGVPIKLLDALARSVPVVATHTAAAGYRLGEHCAVVSDGDVVGFVEALLRAQFADGQGGPNWLARHCSQAAYSAALRACREVSRPRPR